MDAVHQGSDFSPASSWSLIHGIGGIAKRFHLNRSGSRIFPSTASARRSRDRLHARPRSFGHGGFWGVVAWYCPEADLAVAGFVGDTDQRAALAALRDEALRLGVNAAPHVE
jgi:CubicO group peptidase (beta-lactamase class C family)